MREMQVEFGGSLSASGQDGQIEEGPRVAAEEQGGDRGDRLVGVEVIVAGMGVPLEAGPVGPGDRDADPAPVGEGLCHGRQSHRHLEGHESLMLHLSAIPSLEVFCHAVTPFCSNW